MAVRAHFQESVLIRDHLRYCCHKLVPFNCVCNVVLVNWLHMILRIQELSMGWIDTSTFLSFYGNLYCLRNIILTIYIDEL